MSDVAVKSEMEMLACKLRLASENYGYPPPSMPVGYGVSPNGEYFVKLRFGSVNVISGRTQFSSLAAIYSDACQLHFAPWLRKSRIKLAAYNFGPTQAADFLAENEFVRELLIDIECQLVNQGTICKRSVKEAGLNAKATDATLSALLERVAALEEAVKQIHRADGKPVYTPALITTFSPPGAMKHSPKNFVHHESVNPAIAKSVFKL